MPKDLTQRRKERKEKKNILPPRHQEHQTTEPVVTAAVDQLLFLLSTQRLSDFSLTDSATRLVAVPSVFSLSLDPEGLGILRGSLRPAVLTCDLRLET